MNQSNVFYYKFQGASLFGLQQLRVLSAQFLQLQLTPSNCLGKRLVVNYYIVWLFLALAINSVIRFIMISYVFWEKVINFNDYNCFTVLFQTCFCIDKMFSNCLYGVNFNAYIHD